MERKVREKAEKVKRLLGVEEEVVLPWVQAYAYMEPAEIAQRIRENVLKFEQA